MTFTQNEANKITVISFDSRPSLCRRHMYSGKLTGFGSMAAPGTEQEGIYDGWNRLTEVDSASGTSNVGTALAARFILRAANAAPTFYSILSNANPSNVGGFTFFPPQLHIQSASYKSFSTARPNVEYAYPCGHAATPCFTGLKWM